MPHQVVTYLGLGANLGDRAATLRAAVCELDALPELRLTGVSSLYETRHVGLDVQPPHLNAVVLGKTTLAPLPLLAELEALEQTHGRTRKGSGRARPLDLDLLLYGDWVQSDPRLTLPHARLYEREFVLTPLCELTPDLVLPSGEPAANCLRRVVGTQGVRREFVPDWPPAIGA